MNEPLDIRWPIGLVFTLIGALLVAYGLFQAPINAWWGGVLLIFGVGMLSLALRASRRAP